ncbi:autotransporter outer membrane beta-barrel domain-containing protein [Pannonibacter sp. Pt2-lr]
MVRGTALKRLSQEAFDRRFEGGDLSFEGTRVWGEALGSFGRARAADTAFGFSRNMGGLIAGIEARPTDSAMAGIMAGYTGSYLDNKQLGSTATVTAYHAGIYGSYDFAATDMGAVSLRGGAAYSWQDLSTRRNVSFGSISQRLDADYDAGQVQGFGELAYGHMFSGVMEGAFVEGFTGLALVHQDGAKFTETGGSAALSGNGKSLETAFSTVGVRGAVQTGLQGIPVRLTGELAWRHAFGDVAATQTMVLAGSNPFAIRGRALDRDAFLIGTGVSMTMTEKAGPHARLSGRAGGQGHGPQRQGKLPPEVLTFSKANMEDRPDASHPGGFFARTDGGPVRRRSQPDLIQIYATVLVPQACALQQVRCLPAAPSGTGQLLLGPFSRKTYFCFRLCLFLDELFVNFDIFWNLYFYFGNC